MIGNMLWYFILENSYSLLNGLKSAYYNNCKHLSSAVFQLWLTRAEIGLLSTTVKCILTSRIAQRIKDKDLYCKNKRCRCCLSGKYKGEEHGIPELQVLCDKIPKLQNVFPGLRQTNAFSKKVLLNKKRNKILFHPGGGRRGESNQFS